MLRTADRHRYCTHRTALTTLLRCAPFAAASLLLFACRTSTHRDVQVSDTTQRAKAPPETAKLAPAPDVAPASKPGRTQPSDHFLQQEAGSMAREDQGRAAKALEQEAKNAPPPKPRRSPLRPTRRPLPMRRRP